MNKKGFTLIELIAIIIIVSIIMIVSFSSLTRTLKKTKLKEVEDFKTKIETATQIYVETELIRHQEFRIGTYMKIGIDELANNGYIDNDIEVANKCTFANTSILAYKNYDKTITYYVKCDDDYEYYTNGMPIYFNPTTGLVCNDYVETNSNTENTTGCMKWYTFNDSKDASTISMILDHNTKKVIRWSTTSSNTTNADAVKTQLTSDTSLWDSDLGIRLITADEIATITKNGGFDSASSDSNKYFYLDSNNTTSIASSSVLSKYAWLYDRTSTSCKTYGCLNNADSSMTGTGYWTDTDVYNSTSLAWNIKDDGALRTTSVSSAGVNGVRPVITISKDLLQ